MRGQSVHIHCTVINMEYSRIRTEWVKSQIPEGILTCSYRRRGNTCRHSGSDNAGCSSRRRFSQDTWSSQRSPLKPWGHKHVPLVGSHEAPLKHLQRWRQSWPYLPEGQGTAHTSPWKDSKYQDLEIWTKCSTAIMTNYK